MDKNKAKKIVERLIKEELTPNTLIPSFEENPIQYITTKYPSLRKQLVDLLTERFTDYITGIYVMAPKPTTFKIVLHNNQEFFLIYLGKSYQCKVEGKKYYMNTLAEKQAATLAIADLLQLGPPIGTEGPDKEDGAEPEKKSKSSGGSNPYYTPVGERDKEEDTESDTQDTEGDKETTSSDEEEDLEKTLAETKIRFI